MTVTVILMALVVDRTFMKVWSFVMFLIV